LCVEGKFATLRDHSKERAEAVEHATVIEKIKPATIQDCETLGLRSFELHLARCTLMWVRTLASTTWLRIRGRFGRASADA